MDLKKFHIVLIIVAIIFACGLGVWGLRNHSIYGEGVNLQTGIGSFVIAGLLLIYLVFFIKKVKNNGW